MLPNSEYHRQERLIKLMNEAGGTDEKLARGLGGGESHSKPIAREKPTWLAGLSHRAGLESQCVLFRFSRLRLSQEHFNVHLEGDVVGFRSEVPIDRFH